jgi:hypothetical protein
LANAAQRGIVAPLPWAAFAKLGPALALPPRRWRTFVLSGATAIAITLPWLSLWPEWVAYLLGAPRDPGWPTIIPLLYRLPFILGLLVARRPWATMLAAAIAIPGFYLVTAWATLLLAFRLVAMARSGAAASGGSRPRPGDSLPVVP